MFPVEHSAPLLARVCALAAKPPERFFLRITRGFGRMRSERFWGFGQEFGGNIPPKGENLGHIRGFGLAKPTVKCVLSTLALRLTERSTISGILVLISLLGVHIDPAHFEVIGNAVIAVTSCFEILRAEHP